MIIRIIKEKEETETILEGFSPERHRRYNRIMAKICVAVAAAFWAAPCAFALGAEFQMPAYEAEETTKTAVFNSPEEEFWENEKLFYENWELMIAFEEERWKEYSVQEKVNLLQELADFEACRLGISGVSVKSQKLGLSKAGEFDWENKELCIDIHGNLVCKFGMLDYSLSGKLPVKTELAWIEQLINELEEDGADMSEYHRRFQRLSHKKNKKGCYITTAVCESEGKADDCYELQSFRRFRDEWLEKQPDGMEMIQEYYATAPEIVEKINQQPDRNRVYQNIRNKYLNPCLNYIGQGEFEKCKDLYIEMVRSIGN